MPEDDFNASWQWLRNFGTRRGLQEIDPEQVYSMDETVLVDRQLPRYGLLMPNEDVLDALHEHMLVLEDRLLCRGFQNKMGEDYDKIISSFSVFQGHLWDATDKVKQRRVA
jgi:hypothetical protein